MKSLILNGEALQLDAPITLANLIRSLGLEPAEVAVEVNLVVVQRSDHEQFLLSGGERVEIVTLVGGG